MDPWVRIQKCVILVEDPGEVKKLLLKSGLHDLFIVGGSHIIPKEFSFKWRGEIYPFLMTISKIARGYIEFEKEDEIWRVKLENGRITELKAKLVYEEEGTASLPDDVVWEKVITNDRYLAAVIKGRKFIIYDRENKRWLRSPYKGTIISMKLLENLYYGKDLEDDRYVDSIDLSDIDLDDISEFITKITEREPQIEQELKKNALARII